MRFVFDDELRLYLACVLECAAQQIRDGGINDLGELSAPLEAINEKLAEAFRWLGPNRVDHHEPIDSEREQFDAALLQFVERFKAATHVGPANNEATTKKAARRKKAPRLESEGVTV